MLMSTDPIIAPHSPGRTCTILLLLLTYVTGLLAVVFSIIVILTDAFCTVNTGILADRFWGGVHVIIFGRSVSGGRVRGSGVSLSGRG